MKRVYNGLQSEPPHEDDRDSTDRTVGVGLGMALNQWSNDIST